MDCFGKRLRELRMKKEWRQIDLGKVIGVAGSTIALYEQGRRKPDHATLVKLVSALGCSVDYLLGVEEDQFKDESDGTRLFFEWMELIEKEKGKFDMLYMKYRGQVK